MVKARKLFQREGQTREKQSLPSYHFACSRLNGHNTCIPRLALRKIDPFVFASCLVLEGVIASLRQGIAVLIKDN